MHWFQLVHQCLCLMGCRICREPSQGHFLSRRYCRGCSARSSWFRCTLRFSKSRECTPCQGLQGTLYQGHLLSLSRSQFLPLCCPHTHRVHSYYIWPKVVWCGLKWFLFHSAQNILSEPRPNTTLLQKSLKNIGIDVWSGLYGVSTLQCSALQRVSNNQSWSWIWTIWDCCLTWYYNYKYQVWLLHDEKFSKCLKDTALLPDSLSAAADRYPLARFTHFPLKIVNYGSWIVGPTMYNVGHR